MSKEIKYEKVDSNNMREWTRDTELLNKQELQTEKTEWNFIVNMSDTILEKLQTDNPDIIKAEAQAKVDEIDTLLDLLNNTTSQETIDFINED